MIRNNPKRGKPQKQRAALYEVVHVTNPSTRTAVLPKPSAEILYVRQLGLDKRYLVPRAGQWAEVNEEAAFQRAEGLRRGRISSDARVLDRSHLQ